VLGRASGRLPGARDVQVFQGDRNEGALARGETKVDGLQALCVGHPRRGRYAERSERGYHGPVGPLKRIHESVGPEGLEHRTVGLALERRISLPVRR
jgi:hypothetical protein